MFFMGSGDLPKLNKCHGKHCPSGGQIPDRFVVLCLEQPFSETFPRNHHLTKLVKPYVFGFEEFPHQICWPCPFSGLCMNARVLHPVPGVEPTVREEELSRLF